MKRTTLFILSCIMLLCTSPFSTKANYAAGGELIYEWISGATYRFYFKLYRDCGGITEPTTLPLCFSNSCNATTFTATMTKYPMTVTPYKFPCPQLQTKCDNPSATLPGYQEVWYYVDVTLPSQCNAWRAFTYLATRSAALNLTNASTTNMYIEATFNNSGTFEGNSSPYYSNKPFINACQNNMFTYNNGAVDPNSDSLVNEVIQPLTGISSCAGTASNVSFTSAAPSLGLPSNPFQTNNTFSLNAQNGTITFTPIQLGTSTVAIRTKEYRNGVLVGSIMREMPVNTYTCTLPLTPFISHVSVLASDNKLYACAGQPVTFCFDARSLNPAAILWVTDNHNMMFPGSTVNYQNQGTDSVRGCLTWTPPANASGNYALNITTIDSTCGMPGIVYSYVTSLVVYVWNTVDAGPDVAICPGTPFNLAVNFSNVGDMTWSVVSGDMNSLSCTTCTTPTVTPTIPTRYAVAINHLPVTCVNQKDTIDFTTLPYNKPNTSIAASPGANVWPGLNVTFSTTTVYCDTPKYQWRINGNNVPGATNATFSTTTLTNNDIVTCMLTCNDSCIIDTPSNAITMNVATSVDDISASDVRLYPNPNSGSFTLMMPAGNYGLEIVNTLGQVVWSQHGLEIANKEAVDIQPGMLTEGHYILKVGGNAQTDVIRFVIQR